MSTRVLREAASRYEEGRVKVSASRDGDVVRVSIAIGQIMVRPYVFDAMPLSTVEQAIIVYGGRIWIESAPRRPTTFNFTLPIWEDS